MSMVVLLSLFKVAPQVLKELLSTATVVVGVGVFVPITYHEIAEEHASQMGRVSHTVARRTEGGEEFDSHIAKYKPLRLDGEGEWDDEQPLIRERHAEGQDNGIYGS